LFKNAWTPFNQALTAALADITPTRVNHPAAAGIDDSEASAPIGDGSLLLVIFAVLSFVFMVFRFLI
jgi:hypothetical protein